MGFQNYKPGIALGAGLKPSGDAKFPLLQSCDVLVGEDGERLDQRLEKLEGLPKPKGVKTEAEMNAILANATEKDIGTIYKFTGESTLTYEKNTLYMLTGNVPDGDGVSY